MTFDELEKISNNPNRAIVALFNLIEQNLDNDTVGSFNGVTDPFTFMMDAVIGTNAVFLNRLADSTAQGYLVHARNINDLSQHMSDEDWEGVFATPSTTKLAYIISVEEIHKLALPFSTVDGELTNFYKKLVIPKDTIFKLPDGDFWLGHAVEIRLMEHGGIQVVYDTTKTNPFSDLGTNYPERNFIELSGNQFLSIQLPVKQVSIKEIPNKSSNDLVGFRLEETFTDKLYRIRAFIKPWNSNKRVEMTVVYNRTNYDPNYPTLVIDLYDNKFIATIPTVYLQNGLGLGDVTVLVYTTKGVIESDMTTLSYKYHQAEYFNYSYSKGKLGYYEKAIKNADNVKIQSLTPITGGNNGISFSDLKNMMIYGHRKRDTPISEIDLTQKLKEYGYTTIRSIDYPNYRLYRVSNELPIQSNKTYETNELIKINSTIGVYVGSILTSLEDIVSLGVAKDNGRRITILPGTIIDISNPTASIYNSLTTDNLLNSSLKDKVDISLSKTLVGIPYYYVLDTTSNQANTRIYYLQNPKIVEQLFFYENPYLGITLGIGPTGISITNDGKNYIIELVTTSSDSYKNIPDELLGIQMGIDIGSMDGGKTIRGELVGKNKDKERKWRFVIETDFDIDRDDLIYFKGFSQYGKPKDKISSKLTQRVNFIFTYQGDVTKDKSTADTHIDQSLFDALQTAIVETEFTVEFGRRLNNLYTSTRPMIGSEQYERYETNVPDTYKENVYKYENSELVIENNKAVLEHAIGDVIYNEDGTPRLIHLAGDIKYDEKGEPILKEPRKILYYWDFLGFDYNYYLTQDQYDLDYRTNITEHIAYEIMDNLSLISRNRLERTAIMYKPKSTIGYTNVILNDNIALTVKNDLKFIITYYLTHEGYLDSNLKNSLIASTNTTINNILKNEYVSTSMIIQALQTLSDSDIMEVKVQIFSDDRVVDVISNTDSTNRFGVRKKLTITGDNFLTVKEDIELQFKEHRSSVEL